MKTSVTGFPRIGRNRELKFASEKYFRGEISEAELQETAAGLRKQHFLLQKDAGIDYIPSNDFSFYDNVLDTAYLVGIVPERYKKLNLPPLDTYFAMARGYQGEKGDVKALAMKKWFNTNYHYIVPEIEDSTEIHLNGTKPFDAYKEALSYGVDTKPVIIGAYTLLSLCHFTGTKTRDDVKNEIVDVYQEIIHRLEALGASWIQFDEPPLVKDLSGEDIAFFRELYSAILTAESGSCGDASGNSGSAAKSGTEENNENSKACKGDRNSGKVRILLQTYFGDVRDIYQTLGELPFSGIGLDFVEGRETESLINQYGFPEDKILFAGLVNGKNIWRNHYSDTLKALEKLRKKGIHTVLSTSCSLLHVPYNLDGEDALSDEYKKHFAFAEEKLGELKELSSASLILQANEALFTERRPDSLNEDVRTRLASVTNKDYVRQPARAERRIIQKKEFGLPVFPTTTIGSFPQTQDVKRNRSAFRKGEISEETYEAFNKEKIRRCVEWQEKAGLDVLVHGEYERNDMVEYFGEALGGFLFTKHAWVQSYGTRCVKPPIIWGDVRRTRPITVQWSVYAQSLTAKPVKGMLTGPVTIYNWSFPREDISVKESISQIALAIRDEVLDLEKNGIRIIQIDEAALREKLPLRKSDWYRDYLDFAIPFHRSDWCTAA